MSIEKNICNPIKVLAVTIHENYGGASIAAYRIHQAVNAAMGNVQSSMFVKYRHAKASSVHGVDEYVPHHVLNTLWQWVKTKFENRYWHKLWRPYNKTKDQNFKSDLRGMDIGGALNKLDYDVLHLHWINSRFLRLEDIPSDKPIVWTLHDTWQFCGVCHYFQECNRYKQDCGCCPQLGSKDPNDLSHIIWKAKQECYANKNITIVCPSQWLADCVAASGLFGGRDIRVIPNCLDTEVFYPMADRELEFMKDSLHRLNVNDDIPIILFGAMHAVTDKRKGVSSLIAALTILDERGVEANLVIFGAYENELPLQFKHIRVIFVGYIFKPIVLASLYSLATLMVVPSHDEVFGQTASESMACGTPVVAFRCTGIQDVVGKCGGYLAEPFSEEDLAHGIEWVIKHNRNGEMRKPVRQSAVERFSMQVVAQQYVELYKELSRKYQPTNNQKAHNTKFGTICKLARLRGMDESKSAGDMAGYKAQSKYKTYRQYIWHVAEAEYNALAGGDA